MIKKYKKIVISISIIFLIINNFTVISYANNYWINPNDYAPSNLTDANNLLNMGNIIIGVIQFVGSVSSVIVLIVIGLKYMMGSVEEKAEYKQTMMPYIIGAVLVFSITNILGIIQDIVANMN